ncbi:phosphoglycerate mutase family protein [Flavobacterium sp. CS20]|uniref:histidine phosphatase family protein n=1 Tax=Flavobacterium sp. CS20 TaxID=2775246 RepID=UPI001B3A05FA|nr:phosphoglycerate mutase family protein [Flavobacterium sp. CS20]QTY26871.1 histidine phosphatase family protein [Flavobacterium sp. CS20]
MKYTRLVITFSFMLCFACQGDRDKVRQLNIPPGKTPKETTYYLIRHAEKKRDNPSEKNPELSEKGFERSKYWGEYFEDKNLEMFYTTDSMRTFQTMIPIVYPYKAQVQFYEAKDTLFTEEFWTKTYGRNTIIVGHSNTTPKFVNEIIGQDKYKPIPDSINHRLYKVKIDKDGFVVQDTFVNILLK